MRIAQNEAKIPISAILLSSVKWLKSSWVMLKINSPNARMISTEVKIFMCINLM
ncbi:MAG: hypothetical protein RLZ77_1605 [Bacteroidota bacterium]|jgi:hypothetical protein